MVAEIRRGAEKAGRNPADIDVGIYVRICITPDEDKAVRLFKRELASYAFVDSYNKMFARYGLGERIRGSAKAVDRGQARHAPDAISDASARKIATFGNEQAGREFVASFRAAGVTHPVVFPIGPASTHARDYPTTMRALAGA